ncbi:MAG: esterase-like activity of phytase family protein, partial [Bacteroidota bacterium]
VLERSFSTGYDDGGNDVKIYQVDASMATDVSGIDALAGASYTPAIKTLLFDFESVRSQLTDGIVDNIEGITFGPDLPNGKKSLLLVADNNFSAFGPQLNQVILMEVN